MDISQQPSVIPTKLLLFIALLQGLALLLLHQAIETDYWLNAPQWLFALYSLSFITPLMLMLSLEPGRQSRGLAWIAGFSAIIFALGYYNGLQLHPANQPHRGMLFSGFILTLCVATFKALMYVQHFSTGESLSYSRLFTLSWRNFLTVALALLFTLCCWGILMLGAVLFRAININFFIDLFNQRWFIYPVLALANGFGIIIFRQQSSVIDLVTRIQQALMKFLLPALVFVSISFLLALPFTGLQPLWESGGSSLIIWMQALMLFFVNAVYQDKPEAQPYPLGLHRFIYLGLALLPVYSLISCYGLSIRIEQYGWTVARCWAILLWALFALFSLGYLWGIIKHRDRWLQQLSWVNVRMGLVVLALMLLVNSPLLDFRKITVSSQLARLERGEVSLDDFDFRYFRYQLAKPGYSALQQLKAQAETSHPLVVTTINNLYLSGQQARENFTLESFKAALQSKGDPPPEELLSAIYTLLKTNDWRLRQNLAYYLAPVDLNTDAQTDYILLEQRYHQHQLTLFYQQDKQWLHANLELISQHHLQGEEFIEAYQQTGLVIKPPHWQQLEIDDWTFQVRK